MKRNDDEKYKLKIKNLNLKNFVVCFFRFLGIYILYGRRHSIIYIIYTYIQKEHERNSTKTTKITRKINTIAIVAAADAVVDDTQIYISISLYFLPFNTCLIFIIM